MQRTTIDEAVQGQGVSENEFDENVVSPTPPQESGIKFDLSFLKTPTGDGEIEEYMSHPLNFMKSRGFAQILRGVTGFTGNLKLAIIDIVFGAFNFIKERRQDAGSNIPQ